MSVPRPAMLVAMVMAPVRPAWATIGASFSWNLALSVSCLIPRRLSISLRTSDFSTETVPTRTGRPASCISTISSMSASNLPFSVRYTRSGSSTRIIGRWVGIETTSSL